MRTIVQQLNPLVLSRPKGRDLTFTVLGTLVMISRDISKLGKLASSTGISENLNYISHPDITAADCNKAVCQVLKPFATATTVAQKSVQFRQVKLHQML